MYLCVCLHAFICTIYMHVYSASRGHRSTDTQELELYTLVRHLNGCWKPHPSSLQEQ